MLPILHVMDHSLISHFRKCRIFLYPRSLKNSNVEFYFNCFERSNFCYVRFLKKLVSFVLIIVSREELDPKEMIER